MIPLFVDGTNLPPGGHHCTWQELEERFCSGLRRTTLCRELRVLLQRARECGFLRVAVGGSFPTAKPDPGDLDLLFITPRGMTSETVPAQCAELLDSANSRDRFGHDFLWCPDEPDVVERLIHGLGHDTRTGIDRGMVVIDI